MTLQNKIKADIAITTIITFLFIICIGIIYGLVDGEGRNEQVINILTFILFPFTILYEYFELNNSFLIFVCVGLSVLFYCFLFIKLFAKKLFSTKRYKPYILTHISGYIFPTLLIIRLAYLLIIKP